MTPELFPRKICLLRKLRIIDKKWYQSYFQGKYVYWGNLESLIRKSTRTISMEIMPTGET